MYNMQTAWKSCKDEKHDKNVISEPLYVINNISYASRAAHSLHGLLNAKSKAELLDAFKAYETITVIIFDAYAM